MNILEKIRNAQKLQDDLATANAEIARLEAEGTDVAAAIDALVDENTKLKADLAAANAKVAGFDGEKAKLDERAKNLDAEVDKRASAKALEITASQGTEPVTHSTTENP